MLPKVVKAPANVAASMSKSFTFVPDGCTAGIQPLLDKQAFYVVKAHRAIKGKTINKKGGSRFVWGDDIQQAWKYAVAAAKP